MRIIIHSILLCITIGNFIFSQLARTSYVDRKIVSVDRKIVSLKKNLESQINDLERKLGLTSSKFESNASHISKIYPNGIPREVYLYKRGNLEKDKPYKITAKIQYTNDGSIKIINRFHDNGEIMLTGGFIAEQPNGKWIEWYENGQKKNERSYKNGKPNGLWTEWYENGQKYMEGTYKDGEKDGLFTKWSNDGLKEEKGTYKAGKLNGILTMWNHTGRKSSELTYKNGELDGLSTKWYDVDLPTLIENLAMNKDGKFAQTILTVRDQLRVNVNADFFALFTTASAENNLNLSRYYYDYSYDDNILVALADVAEEAISKNGRKYSEATYKDGELIEEKTWEYYENGQKKSEMPYKDGERNGLATKWYDNGKKMAEGTYKDGELISNKCFDDDGNERVCN